MISGFGFDLADKDGRASVVQLAVSAQPHT